jgi:hypothetical protein
MTHLRPQESPPKAPLSPWVRAGLELIQGLLPALTAIAAAVWVAYTYFDHEKQVRIDQEAQASRDNTTRLLEVQKPFNSKQLDLYAETAQVAGRLVTADDVSSPQWKADVRRFDELYWTELSMVEDQGVKLAMVDLRPRLQAITTRGSMSDQDRDALQQSSYRLAKALNAGIASTWIVALSEVTESSTQVCIGTPEEGCPQGSQHLACGAQVSQWAAEQQCTRYSVSNRKILNGGQCGFEIYNVQCTRRKHSP